MKNIYFGFQLNWKTSDNIHNNFLKFFFAEDVLKKVDLEGRIPLEMKLNRRRESETFIMLNSKNIFHPEMNTIN